MNVTYTIRYTVLDLIIHEYVILILVSRIICYLTCCMTIKFTVIEDLEMKLVVRHYTVFVKAICFE